MKKLKTKPIIGVIGGMGPFASLHFHQILLNLFKGDLDLPEILIDSISINDFTTDDTQILPALKIITNRVKFMEKLGIDILVMPCNTAHILHGQIKKQMTANFPNLINLVVDEIKKSHTRNILLLSSPNTVKKNLYSIAFRHIDQKLVLPSAEELVKIEKIIKSLIFGILDPSDVNSINKIISSHQEIDAVILGCTELSLISSQISFPQKFDSLEILANHVHSFITSQR
jgi:aspartate racemase